MGEDAQQHDVRWRRGLSEIAGPEVVADHGAVVARARDRLVRRRAALTASALGLVSLSVLAYALSSPRPEQVRVVSPTSTTVQVVESTTTAPEPTTTTVATATTRPVAVPPAGTPQSLSTTTSTPVAREQIRVELRDDGLHMNPQTVLAAPAAITFVDARSGAPHGAAVLHMELSPGSNDWSVKAGDTFSFDFCPDHWYLSATVDGARVGDYLQFDTVGLAHGYCR